MTKVTFLPSANNSKGEMLRMLRELAQATKLMADRVDHLSVLLQQAQPLAKAA